MGGQFDVEPADLRGAAPAFGTAGADVHKALETLRSTLAGLGDYLGSDEQGKAFKAAYEPKVAEAERAGESIATGLSQIQPALTRSAERYEGDDHGVATGMDGQVR